MPRRLSATGQPCYLPDSLVFAAFSFFATLLVSISAYQKLTRWGEKVMATATRFVAGVFLATAMLDLLSECDVVFHNLGFRYPLAFLVSCCGYVAAMLVDCLLAFLVRKSTLKALDAMMNFLSGDSHNTKSCDTIATTKSHTKDSDGISYLQYLVLNRVTLVVDCCFLIFPLGTLSALRGAQIASANTKTMAWRAFLRATSINIIYAVSWVITVLRICVPKIPSIEWLFVAFFSTMTPIGVILELTSSKYDSIPVNGTNSKSSSGNNDSDAWFAGIITGVYSGYLVYLSMHHLMTDGNDIERSVWGARFRKFVAMVYGIAAVALFKVLAS